MARKRRKKKREGPGGFRGTQGRNSLFPNKGNPLTGGKGVKKSILLTPVGNAAVERTQERLTHHKPAMATADAVGEVSYSDAVEYLIRKATNTPLED